MLVVQVYRGLKGQQLTEDITDKTLQMKKIHLDLEVDC